MISIFLPDKSEKQFKVPPTALEVAASVGVGLAKEALAVVKLVGDSQQLEIQDIRSILNNGEHVRFLTKKDVQSLDVIRHSTAHVMAQAVQELWPSTQVTIGPVIEDGFYYDFDSSHKFVPEDLKRIEKKMKDIISQKLAITRKQVTSEEAMKSFEKLGEKYKMEIIKDLKKKEVTIYFQGQDWFDLCQGPHVQNLSQIKAFKLMSIAGSYWRGDEKKSQLQRIYGTAFHSQKDLEQHLELQEEIAKRDHRILGKQLKLFYFNTDYSPGLPFYTKKGYVLYRTLENYMRTVYHRYNYDEISTPLLYSKELFQKSGHYENYKENMYFTNRDETSFKPMNCPGHCLLYKSERYSYKDLPLRFAEFGKVHRYERRGVLHGMSRVRGFTQDDGHIFCSQKDLVLEIQSYMSMLSEIYKTLGMPDFKVYLSTRPPKRMGSEEVWDKSETALSEALKALDIIYEIDKGQGAFYGPKLDIVVKDSCKRPWQLGTLQCDFNMPEAFDLIYVDQDNKEKRPIMLHRAVFGSLERFIGVYLEHTAGHLPLWLAPVQIIILSVGDEHKNYANRVSDMLISEGLRVKSDLRAEKLGYKIREAQVLKIPYMLVVGDKEVESNTLSVRLRTGQSASDVALSRFVSIVKEANNSRKFDLESFN